MGPDGTPWLCPWTDVRDVVQGVVLALESPHAVGETFNLVGPEATSYVSAARIIAENTDRPYREVQMPFPWAYHISNDKARTILGYTPEYDFARMVESAVAFRRGEDIGVIPV